MEILIQFNNSEFLNMVITGVTLTEAEYNWFGERLDENMSGAVRVPSHCYTKFKRITNNEFYKNYEIKTWLIDNVYNARYWNEHHHGINLC